MQAILNGGTLIEKYQVMNILDAYKDATQANPSVNLKTTAIREKFQTAVRFMTGWQQRLYTSTSDLKLLEDTILGDRTLGPEPVLISMLKPNKKIPLLTESIIPDTYTKAFIDAAANPTDYQPNIEIFETAGSHIDPATRSKPAIIVPTYAESNNGAPLIIPLQEYGFATGSTFSTTTLQDTSIIVVIHFPALLPSNALTITVRFDNHGSLTTMDINGNAIGQQHALFKLFEGNATKNTFINNSVSTQDDINAFVICKELGDAIQSILLHFLFTQFSDRYNATTCITFTPDIVFASRCRLLGSQPPNPPFYGPVPCLLKKVIKGSEFRNLLLYSGTRDMAQQQIEINRKHVNQCIYQNLALSNTIAPLIIRRFVIIGGQEVELNINGLDFLQSIIDRLIIANTLLDTLLNIETPGTIPSLSQSIDDVRLYCANLTAYNLFGKSKNKPNMSIKQLFPKDNENGHIQIYFDKGFAQTLNKYIVIQGGGDTSLQSQKPFQRHKSLNDRIIDQFADDYYDYFFSYLFYIGATYIDDKFLLFLLDEPTLVAARIEYLRIISELVYSDNGYTKTPPKYDIKKERDIFSNLAHETVRRFLTNNYELRKKTGTPLFMSTNKGRRLDDIYHKMVDIYKIRQIRPSMDLLYGYESTTTMGVDSSEDEAFSMDVEDEADDDEADDDEAYYMNEKEYNTSMHNRRATATARARARTRTNFGGSIKYNRKQKNIKNTKKIQNKSNKSSKKQKTSSRRTRKRHHKIK
jgi:hypothetical protein